MDVDPLASMRCWAIDVELAGWTYTIPPRPAADWWPALETGSTASVIDLIDGFPDSAHPRRPDLNDLILELPAGELTTALTDAVETATGRSLHASAVLAASAREYWPAIGGAIAKTGFRWDQQSIAAALDLIYLTFASSMDEKRLEEFDRLLENESLSAGKPTERQRAKASGEFEQLAGPRPTGGARSTGERSGNARPRTRRQPRQPRQADQSLAPTPPPG